MHLDLITLAKYKRIVNNMDAHTHGGHCDHMKIEISERECLCLWGLFVLLHQPVTTILEIIDHNDGSFFARKLLSESFLFAFGLLFLQHL